jgi:hypothetical protein
MFSPMSTTDGGLLVVTRNNEEFPRQLIKKEAFIYELRGALAATPPPAGALVEGLTSKPMANHISKPPPQTITCPLM